MDDPSNHECIGEYKFYSIGTNATRFDSYIDEYIIIPPQHPLVGTKLRFSVPGSTVTHFKDNIYHWQRYYSHSPHHKRICALKYFIRNDGRDTLDDDALNKIINDIRTKQ